MRGYKDLTSYETSALIGLWRMGNQDVIIATFICCEIWQVQKAIRDHIFNNN